MKQVETIEPKNASAYFEVAEGLDSMRQYPRAIDKYKVAVQRAPWWTAALNGLGLLYTQSGDEDEEVNASGVTPQTPCVAKFLAIAM